MNQITDFLKYILNEIKPYIIVQPWQKGIRVRSGKHIKMLHGGIFFKIPYIDSVYVQEVRIRTVQIPRQTLTTKDFKTVTIDSSLGYSIDDVEKLYNTIYHPESTLVIMIMSSIADFVLKTNLLDIKPLEVQESIIKEISANRYGVKIEQYGITSFASVRTFRLINDGQTYIQENVDMKNQIK